MVDRPARFEEFLDASRLDDQEAIGLVQVAGDLGQELVGGHADRSDELQFPLDVLLEDFWALQEARGSSARPKTVWQKYTLAEKYRQTGRCGRPAFFCQFIFLPDSNGSFVAIKSVNWLCQSHSMTFPHATATIELRSSIRSLPSH